MSIINTAYHGIDMLIMDGVNAGAKAFNYITGGNEEDLSKLFNLSANASFGAGFYIWNPLSFLFASPFLLLDFILVNRNIRLKNAFKELDFNDPKTLAEYENKYDAKTFEKKKNEIIKENLKNDEIYGYINSGLGGTLTYFGYELENPVLLGFGLGNLLMSASHYVNRADDLERKPNLVKRGLERMFNDGKE